VKKRCVIPGALLEAAAKGGRKTSRLHGKKFKENRAQSGGQTCLLRYGRDFFRSIVAARWKKEAA
jgi:hypothetical protein